MGVRTEVSLSRANCAGLVGQGMEGHGPRI